MRTKTNILAAGILLAMTLAAFSQPTITKQPTDQSVSLGAIINFQVSAVSTNPPVLYQWRFSTTNMPMATNHILMLTNIQTTNAGAYDVVLTDGSGSIISQVAHLDVDPTFTKITTGSIVTASWPAISCAWGDYDNDGFIDLIVASPWASLSPPRVVGNVLFHNNRDGTFTRITNNVITTEARDWRGCAWADYDNDGHLDLFVTSNDSFGFPAENELFRNNGDGSFTKMTHQNAGDLPSLAAGSSEACVWADYDNDGFLVIFVARFGPDWLFHNNGDGTFTKMTNTVSGLLQDNRDSYGAMWGDYDNDGRPDLFVAVKDDNGINQTNFLYHNQGNGVFTRIVGGRIGTDNEYSGGCAWADYDNDGYLDLLVTNGKYSPGINSLYRNNGNGTFTKMTSTTVGSIASDSAAFASCTWGDYDNDGFLDLFLTVFSAGGPAVSNYLYHNNGDGSFTRVRSGSLVNDRGQYAWSCAWGDYDNDGFLDLFVARGDDPPLGNLLYRNNGNSNAWIKVKLVGTASNRSGIGAKVRVQATIHGKPMRQMREINTGNGFSASPLEAHFGLGDATNIDELRIEWPSGTVQTMANVSPKQFLTVVEHQQPVTVPPPPSFTSVSRSDDGSVNLTAAGDTSLIYVFEAATDLGNWTKVGVRSNATGVVRFTDTKATNYSKRFYRVAVP